MTHTPTKKSLHPLLAPALLIVLFAAASFASIMIIEQERIATNQVAWMSYSEYPAIKLSEKQVEIIQNSAVMTSGVAEDAGVKVTLASVCGNGYTTYYKLDVELPENIRGWSFGTFELRMNDENTQLMNKGTSLSSLQDDNQANNHYSLLLKTEVGYCSDFDNSFHFDYPFNNGIPRTLHLENIQVYPENAEPSTVIKGQWDFEILFRDEGKVLELIHEPVIVSGFSDHKYFEATLTSMTISEFSLNCRYDLTSNTKHNSLDGMGQWIIMKDGRTVKANLSSGIYSDTNGDFSWNLDVPISLEEAAYVKMSDDVLIPISQNTYCIMEELR